MNREIKFRAYHRGNMIYPDGNGYFKLATYREICLIDGIGKPCIINEYMETPDQFELMQYTGLKDKNETEIYEGDILKIYTWKTDDDGDDIFSLHQVVWGGDQYPAFDIHPNYAEEINGLSDMACNPEYDFYEVVGNIYENAELVKLINDDR